MDGGRLFLALDASISIFNTIINDNIARENLHYVNQHRRDPFRAHEPL